MKSFAVINTVLALMLVASAVTVVYAVHRNRLLLGQLQQLREQRDQLNVAWGRLQLEESTWATHARIQQFARKKLNMHVPQKSQRVVVEP